MEYTNEFLARVYGAYMGCSFKNGEKEFPIKGITITGVSTWDNEFPFHYKLLLTPLSEISDEDAIGVGKIFGYSGSGDANCIRWAKYWIDDTKSGNGWAYHKAISAIDYLRSKGYDTGFAEIPSLIDAGIAIKKQQP